MLLTAALLGAIQGLTEFLPISSSAHLILARSFAGWEAAEFGLAFDVALHLGTLAAIIVFFWSDIFRMIVALPSCLSPGAGPSGRLIRLIAVRPSRRSWSASSSTTTSSPTCGLPGWPPRLSPQGPC